MEDLPCLWKGFSGSQPNASELGMPLSPVNDSDKYGPRSLAIKTVQAPCSTRCLIEIAHRFCPSFNFSLQVSLPTIKWFASLFCCAVTILSLSFEIFTLETVAFGESVAQPRNTLFLYELCKLNQDRPVSWCEGYLMGMADILLALGNSHIAGGICNAEYDPATLRRIFEFWVERYPERLQEEMAIGVQGAFRELWPCR